MLLQVSEFLFNVATNIFDSLLSDWGIIGLGIVSTFLLIRVVNFIRRLFK